MTGIGSRSVDVVSQWLEHDEREAVLGDLQEAGESTWKELCGVLGLVIRRQVELWGNWRPWITAFGVALPGALLLMGFSLGVSRNYQLYSWIVGNYSVIDSTVLKDTGLTLIPGIPLLLCNIFLLISWAWTGGFLLGALSRRTLWVSALLVVLPCLFCLTRFRDATLPRFCLLLFLLPAIWGVRRSLRMPRMHLLPALALALTVTVLTIFSQSAHARPNLTWALCWPAWYLAATARRRFEEAVAICKS
jgi:hypothetical protein